MTHLNLGTHRIETERLVLRRFVMTDALPMFNTWTSDPVVAEYMRWNTHTSVMDTRLTVGRWVQNYRKNGYEWAICLKDGTLIGSIGIIGLSRADLSAEAGYCIARPYWNKGYCTEALIAMLDYLFNRVGLNRIEAFHALANPASGRVMEKCGMRREGVCRQKYNTGNGLQDCALYAILREDFIKNTD